MEIEIGSLFVLMGIPSAVTGLAVWFLKRHIDKRDMVRKQYEERREAFDVCLINSLNASIALGEATARAVQRIPDAHCNGDMHAALEYTKTVKHEQKDFLIQQGIDRLHM